MENQYTEEDIMKIKVECANNNVGNLKGIDCPLCKNKGKIWLIKDNRIVVRECSCLSKRNIINQLVNCGITAEMLDKYTFDNYKCDEDYQKIIYKKATNYVDTVLNNDSKKWFFFGGISGIGKTHICTAIFQSLLDKGFSGKYMLWKNEIPQLKTSKKSFDEYKQREYINKMNEISNVDVLYIDDFLKFLDTRSNDDLDIAYEIINDRYCNNKITIISTEYNKDEMCNIDMALFGRIYEKSNEYFIQPLKDIKRNYRLK